MRLHIIFIYFISIYSFGQNSFRVKEELQNLLKEKGVSLVACNEENDFFTSDTIRMSTRIEEYKCSEIISWDFTSKNHFTQHRRHYVKGTHAMFEEGVTNTNDKYNLKLKSSDSKTILLIYLRDKYIQSLELINFKSKDNIKSITLLRI